MFYTSSYNQHHRLYIRRFAEDLKQVNIRDLTYLDIYYDIFLVDKKTNRLKIVKVCEDKEIITFGCCVTKKIYKKYTYRYFLRRDHMYYLTSYIKPYIANMKFYPKINIEELVKECYKPSRIQYLLDNYNVDIEDIHK
jgi:hypothetical protein